MIGIAWIISVCLVLVVCLVAVPVPVVAAWVSLIDETALTGITADVSTLNTFFVGIFVVILGAALILGIMSRGGR